MEHMERGVNLFYTSLIGFIFTFNLIIGTGALALPKAFSITGWILGGIGMCLIAFFSYISALFVTDSIKCTILLRKEDPKRKYEIGQLSSIYFGTLGKILFYISLIIYLFGDLTIYSVAISQTLTDVICSYQNRTEYCYFFKWHLSKINIYHVCLGLFFVFVIPFSLFQIDKTKYLQILTNIARWTAFTLMIGLSSLKIYESKLDPQVIAYSSEEYVIKWNIIGLPSLFGIAIYSFMCHHSIPSLILIMPNAKSYSKPMLAIQKIKFKVFRFWHSRIVGNLQFLNPFRIRSESMNDSSGGDINLLDFEEGVWIRPYEIFALTYIIVTGFYLMLCILACYAFPMFRGKTVIKDLYTLNFVDDLNHGENLRLKKILGYFLALFPIFPLATNFPIIAVTLRNNISNLIKATVTNDASSNTSSTTFNDPPFPDDEQQSLLSSPNNDGGGGMSLRQNSNDNDSFNNGSMFIGRFFRWFLSPNNYNNNSSSYDSSTSLLTHRRFFPSGRLVTNLFVSAITLGPPACIAWFAPTNLGLLISLTGAYPGLMIQCLIPALLALRARKALTARIVADANRTNDEQSSSLDVDATINDNLLSRNDLKQLSKFSSSTFWIFLTIFWVIICTILVTIHLCKGQSLS